MTTNDPEITGLLEAYAAAAFAKDVDAMVALYDETVEVFDLWGDWTYSGRDAWQAVVADWFGSLGDERVRVAFDRIRTERAGELASVHANVRYEALAVDGTVLRGMWNRLTWVLRRRQSRWQIVHAHTSAPIDPASLKVRFSR